MAHLVALTGETGIVNPRRKTTNIIDDERGASKTYNASINAITATEEHIPEKKEQGELRQ